MHMHMFTCDVNEASKLPTRMDVTVVQSTTVP